MATRLILPLLAALLACPGLAAAENAPAGHADERQADWTRRLEEAKEMQREGAARKEAAKEIFEAAKKECFKKFRVNACQNDARQEYIQATSEARRIENEGSALERQVKKEQVADKDNRRTAEAPRREADLQAREGAQRTEMEKGEADRAAKIAQQEEKARLGAERHAADEERRRKKLEKHERVVAEKMERARRREEEAAR